MPCYEPDNTYAQGVIDGTIDADRRARIEFRHNSDVAQLLCEVMCYLEGQLLVQHNQHLSPQLLTWWAEHQQRDATR